MEITKVVKPVIRRGANTFGNIVCIICMCDTGAQHQSKDTSYCVTRSAGAGPRL